MYAMEYPKQERAAPAAIAIVANLALIYVFAVGLGVVPSITVPEPFTVVDVPKMIEDPMPLSDSQVDPNAFNDHSLPSFPMKDPVIEVEREVVGPSDTGEPTIDTHTVGSSYDLPVTNARVLRSFEPPYPNYSRLSGEEGTVLVKASISPYGVIGDVQIEKSSGYARLDEAALKAVRAWRFAPATRGSQAIATWVTVPVKFVLNGRN